ncbi:hypothetical protein OF83DRAFT_1145378 [Amylostereum chailletii]|nr:hypothetical protein OF83DRAFT_1145378 [Amylostereum chailletii]
MGHRRRTITTPPSQPVGTSRTGPPLSLIRLGHDPLHLIATELLRDEDLELRHFSSTCRDIRSITLPIYFRRSVCVWNEENETVSLPPSTLWPYIQSICCLVDGPFYLPGSEYPVASLGEYLQQLPYLCSVVFGDIFGGVPLNILRAFFIPSIRNIYFDGSSWAGPIPSVYPELPGLDWPPIDAQSVVDVLPPIVTEFMYMDSEWRQVPSEGYKLRHGGVKKLRTISYEPEVGYLRPLVMHIHPTVRKLSLPAESTPFGAMAKVHWPCLLELRLWGRYPEAEELKNIVPALSMMPHLRDLELVAGHPDQSDRVRVWSESAAPVPDFVQLRTFKLSYPNSHDLIFSHLPPTLRHLSLRDEPRHYHFDPRLSRGELHLSSPIPSSSELLQILSQCRFDELYTLEVVYRADDAERELLAYIASEFSCLDTLEVHRYEKRLMDMAELARILSPLQRLRVLRYRFECKKYIGMLGSDARTSRCLPVDRAEPDMFPAVADDFVRAFVSPVAPPNLEMLSMLHVRMSWDFNCWERWRVIESQEGGRKAENLPLGER